MSIEYHDTAACIFLASIHRAMERTGERPVKNIISRALFDRIVDETFITRTMMDPLPIGRSQILGFPVRVVESPHLFAISIDAPAV